jgi:hypothetical protein
MPTRGSSSTSRAVHADCPVARRAGFLILSLLALTSATATLVSAAPATPARQHRIVIEQKMAFGAREGRFVLHVLTPGPVGTDTGSFAHRDGARTGTIRGGQGVARYLLLTQYSGKHGSFLVRQQLELVAAGNSYTVGTGTWSIVGGAGAYAGMIGSGRQGSVLTDRGVTLSQSEGLVRVAAP